MKENYPSAPADPGEWIFLTQHALVLLCLVQAPTTRSSDIAKRLKLTERWVQQIVKDLVDSGCVTRQRLGRRNYYTIHLGARLGHPTETQWCVKDLLTLFLR